MGEVLISGVVTASYATDLRQHLRLHYRHLVIIVFSCSSLEPITLAAL